MASNYNNNRPAFPSVGTMYLDPQTGVTEIWDGYAWSALASPGFSASPIFTSQIATTQYVNNTMNGTTTFNSADRSKQVTVDEIIDVVEFMKLMKRRMFILEPAFEKHEHFPALKEAYENYLLIERLCSGDDIDEE
jgi:hypothetical protein